jgi:hypothetical protein
VSGPVGPQGYPDWVRAPQVALSPLLSLTNFDLASGLGPQTFYTGDAAGLVLTGRLGDASAGLGSTYTFSDDQAVTTVTGEYTVVYDKDGTDFYVADILPVLGNFVTVVVPALALANLTLSLTPLCTSMPGCRALPN